MKIFYWVTFVLSIVVIVLNVGLGLFALGIIILPVLILHGSVGVAIDRVREKRKLLILSAVNLLIFALIRPDGVHTLTDNGLSSVLDVAGINAARYSLEHEDFYFGLSLVLLLFQVVVDVWLRRLIKKVS